MKKILAFAGSNSPTSINHQLIMHVARRITKYEVDICNLRELSVPIFGIEREKEGYPEDIRLLHRSIRESLALIISVNENNRNVSAFFKNIIDWLSRIDRSFLEGKKILLMSTSPGKRGGAAALEYSKNIFTVFGGTVIEHFSLPQFYDNFDLVKGQVVNEVFDMGIEEVVVSFSNQIGE